MPRLCFRRQDSGGLIAEARAQGSSGIPAVDDRIYAPSAADPGVYSHHRVTGREFYYDQRGDLSLVTLECVEVSS